MVRGPTLSAKVFASIMRVEKVRAVKVEAAAAMR
jgi:hypothetical protein